MRGRAALPRLWAAKLSPMPKNYSAASDVIDQSKRYEAVISTPKGEIVIAMDPARAPKTVNNFVFLIQDGFYDGLTFHRVVDNFIIQGGCPEGNGRGGPGYSFADEPIDGDYIEGSVAMANSGPNSNGSQFFISTRDNRTRLGRQYNLFGQVIKGLDVVQSIRQGEPITKITVAAVEPSKA